MLRIYTNLLTSRAATVPSMFGVMVNSSSGDRYDVQRQLRRDVKKPATQRAPQPFRIIQTFSLAGLTEFTEPFQWHESTFDI